MSKSIVDRFLAIFGSNAIGVLASLLATPVIVRLLGSRRYGEYAFMLSVLSILLLFVNAGIYDGIRKFLKESDRPEQWADHVFSFYSRVGIALSVAIVAAIAVTVQTGVLARHLGPRFERYFLLIGATVVTQQAFASLRSALMGFDREDISEMLFVVNKLLAVGLGLALVVLGYGVSGLIAAKLAANTVTTLAGGVATARFIDYRYLLTLAPDDFPRGRLLRFNLASIVLFGLFLSIKHVDILLLQFLRGSAATGYYKAALNLAEFVWFVPRIVQTTLLHSTSELWSEERYDAITEISTKVTRYSLLFTALLVIGLGTLAEPTVRLYYGAEFQPSVLPLVVLLPGAMGFAVARPILAIGQGKGEFRYLIYATGGASVINLVLNLTLIPVFGILGAAVATTVGYFSMFLFHVYSARHIGFDPLADLRLPNIVATMALATVGIVVLATAIQSIPLTFLVVPAAGFLLYVGVAVAVGAVSVEEMRELREQVPV